MEFYNEDGKPNIELIKEIEWTLRYGHFNTLESYKHFIAHILNLYLDKLDKEELNYETNN